MSCWKAALDGSVSGTAKLHSMEHSRIITFSRGLVMLGAGRVYSYLEVPISAQRPRKRTNQRGLPCQTVGAV